MAAAVAASERAQLLSLIANVKAAINRKADASDSDESELAFESNRGQKLKRKAREVNQGHLQQPTGPKIYLEEVEYANRKRRVLYRKRRRRDSDDERGESDKDDNNNNKTDTEDDPYHNVHIEKLLAPVSAPSEIPTHPALSLIYKSKTLNELCQQALDIICAEHRHVTEMKNLLTHFIGDDSFVALEKMETVQEPAYIRSAREKIEQLEAEERERQEREAESKRKEAQEKEEREQALLNGTVKNLKTEDESPPTRNSNSATPQPQHRMTTRSALNPPSNNIRPVSPTPPPASPSPHEIIENTSPWFYPPSHNVLERNFGLNHQEAEETRQLLLMAVQKEDEFIRGLVKVREGLLKAERLRKNVWEWCRADGVDEMSDGEDWVDEERWGLEPGELKKGMEEEEEEDVRGKKTTRGRK